MSLMLEQIKAKLASIAEIKNADASGKQAELMSAQAEMQLKQVMNMINLAQAPQTQQGQEPVPEMITQQQQEVNVPDVSQQDQPSPNMSEPIFTE